MGEEDKTDLSYSIGDKIRVVSIQNEEYRGDCEVGVGAIGVIKEAGKGTFLPYYIQFDDEGCWYFDEENLELVTEQSSMKTELGVKYDSDKLEYSLLPKGVLNKVISVLGFGSKKYAKDNWMKVDNPKERYYNAAQRHINQWWEGEKYDSETGENHLAHAICCLMFMLWFDNQEDKEVNK